MHCQRNRLRDGILETVDSTEKLQGQSIICKFVAFHRFEAACRSRSHHLLRLCCICLHMSTILENVKSSTDSMTIHPGENITTFATILVSVAFQMNASLPKNHHLTKFIRNCEDCCPDQHILSNFLLDRTHTGRWPTQNGD